MQHYIVSSDTLLSSSGSNGVTPRPVLSQRHLRRQDQVISSQVNSVSTREEHPGSELPGGVQGLYNPHREFRISLHRNPSRDSRGNANLDHIFWTSPVLSDVSSVSIPQTAATPEPQGTIPERISESGLEHVNARHGRNPPTASGSGIWSDFNSRTTWWSLSECDLISERSAPEPPTQYRNIDIAQWISEAIQQPRSSPIPSPGRETNQTSFIWESSTPRRIPDSISPPQSPKNVSQSCPTPARRLRGRFTGVEQDI